MTNVEGVCNYCLIFACKDKKNSVFLQKIKYHI